MEEQILLLGCGILKNEVEFLIKKNRWPVESRFYDSSLHVDFDALRKTLASGLERNADRDIVVFYGECHPLMEHILKPQASRVEGQNCIEFLLGTERFTDELAAGAFFLLEDWALNWDRVISRTLGENPAAVRELFQSDHQYLLCLRTPCSGDFEAAALKAGRKAGLPLRWLDVSLDCLETVLNQALQAKFAQSAAKDEIKVSRHEWESARQRVRQLAEAKAHLQMMNSLMTQLRQARGLDDTVDTMFRIVMETVGGVHLCMYYFIDERLHYADVFGKKEQVERISDADIEEVMQTHTFKVKDAEFSHTQMQTPQFTRSMTYIFPLLAGDDLVGVFKMEGMLIPPEALQSFLDTFFHYAALTLQHEIMSFSALRKSHDTLKKNHLQLNRDVMLAANVQRALLPPDFSDPFLVLESIYQPCRTVSGDFFDYVWSNDHKCFSGYVLDVSGHGIASSLQGMVVGAYFREALLSPMSLSAKLHWINQRVLHYFTDETFAAAICFEFDFSQRTLTYACAGIYQFAAHCAALPGVVVMPGSLIGVVSTPEYFEATVPIREGESFYFMSDGIFERLSESHLPNPGCFAETVEGLRKLAMSDTAHDDCSAVCIRISGQQSFPLFFEFSRTADRNRIRARLHDVLKEILDEQAGRVEVAVGEAISNAARQSIAMRVKLSVIGQRLLIRVRDYGDGFEGNERVNRYLRAQKHDLFDERRMDEGGRGILIMVVWMDKVIYNRKGNEVLLVKSLRK